MTEDEQFAESVRYGIVPVCLIRVPSGKIAVHSGFNPRKHIATLDEGDVLAFVLALEPEAPPPPTPDVLAELDPFDI